MVDFSDYLEDEQDQDFRNLVDLYYSLDLQASHTHLRQTQSEGLERISEKLDDRDLVLKISTGAGKTVIGLVYLYAQMKISKRPAVFLCPTNQLVNQVIEEAARIGIPAFPYPKGEPHPPHKGQSAEAIIVCTYEKMFNAKSTFERSDVMLRPGALVLDDIHAGIERIRQGFTLQIGQTDIRRRIITLFNSGMQTYNPAIWQNILENNPAEMIEVPYWILESVQGELLQILNKESESDELKFVWPYLREILFSCRIIIGGNQVEITPEILPIFKVPVFQECSHRLYLTATMSDTSVLVRELGCDLKTGLNPIILDSDRGLGERMILAPGLIDPKLSRDWIMSWAAREAKSNNVVVLCGSSRSAERWLSIGAEFFPGDRVEMGVSKLKETPPSTTFAVFAQRYDGIDFPDRSCRILIIDGMPFGESLTEKHDHGRKTIPTNFTNRLVFRIEQGMGRAVRSHADFAVIILVGAEIANFISRRETIDLMTAGTRLQLELALELAKIAKEQSEGKTPEKIFEELVRQCLKRERSWKSFYDKKVRKPIQNHLDQKEDENRIMFAHEERTAASKAFSNNFPESVAILRGAINKYVTTDLETGWNLQKVAKYLWLFDRAQSLEVQQAAHEKNHNVSRPSMVTRRPKIAKDFVQENAFLEWYEKFDNPNGAIAFIETLRPRLSFDISHNIFEEAIRELGEAIGTSSSRPEKELGEGPDNLWILGGCSIVIEVKNDKERFLYRKDSGQLHDSLQWFRERYPTYGEPLPLIISPTSQADSQAHFPESTRILTVEGLSRFIEEYKKVVESIVAMSPRSAKPDKIKEKFLRAGIGCDSLKKYTAPVSK